MRALVAVAAAVAADAKPKPTAFTAVLCEVNKVVIKELPTTCERDAVGA